jgi:hypothetical protein
LTVGNTAAKNVVFTISSVYYEQWGKCFRVYGITLNGGPARALHLGKNVPFKLVSFQYETIKVGAKLYWHIPVVKQNTYKDEATRPTTSSLISSTC